MSTDLTELELPVRLEVWADIACPWCFIGATRLEAVLTREWEAGRAVAARHRPFQLQPELPEDGVPLRPFFEAKFGGPEQVAQAFEQVSEVGRSVGIAFDFDAMPKAPNTRLAHALVLTFDGDPRQRPALLALYSAYFEHGLDITDRHVVVSVVAEALGEPAVAIDDRLSDSAQVDAALELARALGVTAVPMYVADAGVPDDEYGLSPAAVAVTGAQPARTLAHLLEEARRRAQS